MVAINVALGYGADTQATTGLIKIRPLTELAVTKDGRRFLVVADWESRALSVELIALEVTPGEPYETDEVEPRGKRRVFIAPSVDTNYADLDFLEEVGPSGSGGYLVQQAAWVLLSTEDLPPDALPGQVYFETDTNIFGKVGA
jgi:hypothetical protein